VRALDALTQRRTSLACPTPCASRQCSEDSNPARNYDRSPRRARAVRHSATRCCSPRHCRTSLHLRVGDPLQDRVGAFDDVLITRRISVQGCSRGDLAEALASPARCPSDYIPTRPPEQHQPTSRRYACLDPPGDRRVADLRVKFLKVTSSQERAQRDFASSSTPHAASAAKSNMYPFACVGECCPLVTGGQYSYGGS